MRIIKFISPLVFMAMICISIYSCGSDNPVTPPVDTTFHFDSAHYIWTSDIIEFDNGAFLYVPDTNNIYSLVSPYIVRDRHGFLEYLRSSDNSSIRGFNGIDANHIFVAASSSFIGTEKNINRLFKYNGISFTELPFLTDTVTSFQLINGITVVSENELWFRTFSSRIYSYIGSKTTSYDLDSGYIILADVFKTAQGIFVNSVKYKGEYQLPDTSRIYKFDGSKFVSIYSVQADYSYGSNFQMKEMNNEIYSPRLDGIYRFTGSDFIKIISPPEHSYVGFGGKNESEFIMQGFSGRSFDETYIINWNGSKWSKEFPPTDEYMSNVYKIDDKYYFALFDGVHTRLYTGRPKN